MKKLALVLVCLSLVACTGDGDETPALDAAVALDAGTADAGPPDAGAPDAGTPDSGVVVPMTVTSDAFTEAMPVPVRHQCGPPLFPMEPGMNVSPRLAWTAGPPTTMSYAIVLRDRSAGGLVHWAIYDIAATTLEIAEDVPAGYEPAAPAGAKQAEIQNSGYFGYFGPCSGGRGNRYEWTVHAMPGAELPGVGRNTTERNVAAAIEAMSLDSATLTGVY